MRDAKSNVIREWTIIPGDVVPTDAELFCWYIEQSEQIAIRDQMKNLFKRVADGYGDGTLMPATVRIRL